MENRKSNELALREKIIREYLTSHNEVPTPRYSKYLTLNSLEENKRGLLVNEVSIKKVARQGRDSSSISKYRETCYNLKSDLETSLKKLNSFKERIVTQHKSYIGGYNNLYSKIKINIAEANRQLLLSLRADKFVYGITESFETLNNINLENSNTSFLDKKVSLGFDNYEDIGFSLNEIDISSYCKNGYIDRIEVLNSKNNLLKKDGSSYKYIAYTNSSSSIVDLEFTINLNSEENIDQLLVAINNIEVNGKCNINVYYSLDGVGYEDVYSNNIRAQDGENFFDIYKENVKKLKVKITKFSYDFIKNGKFGYFFYVDFIGKVKYNYLRESTLLTKAYEVLDENKNPVDFSLATLKTGTCCIIPDKSSIDFYLSKDGVSWKSISHNSEGNEIIEFRKGIDNEALGFLEQDEYVNYYLLSNINYIEGSLRILRNYGKWYVDRYGAKTTLEIENVEGKYIDLQDKSCVINNENRSGIVFLSKGKHKIALALNEFFNTRLDEGLNLKYLFEGYSYPLGYEKTKKYIKLGEIYESELKSVSLEQFNLDESDRNVFYKEVRDDGTFFKIHDKNSSEEFVVEIRTNENINNNKLYIKAVLRSSQIPSSVVKNSPKIDQIQVRVI